MDIERRLGRLEALAGDGYVSCSYDGRPVTTSHQTSAEDWYRRELESGYGHLIHDPEAETFHTHSGHLALSRYVVEVHHLFPP